MQTVRPMAPLQIDNRSTYPCASIGRTSRTRRPIHPTLDTLGLLGTGISLLEWLTFGIGKFLLGVSLGMVLDFDLPYWVLIPLIASIVFEIPSLIAVYKHK